MTFEEQFPSLKGKESKLRSENMYFESFIERYCLDKQKVKEAITYQRIDVNGSLIEGLCKKDAEYLLKELGL